MLDTLLSGGPFMMVLVAIFCIIIFISIKNINEPFKTNSIVLLGILSALFGILGTYIGLNAAFSAVPQISNISPEILINGIKTSLITSYAGGIIMLFSALAWYYFVKKHNLINAWISINSSYLSVKYGKVNSPHE